MIKIGVTGGIGSGKSTACRVFALLGIPCYDSDREAKRLMNTDPLLKTRIAALLGPKSYTAQGLDRSYVSSRVFTHPHLLQELNAIVHPAVATDFARWADQQHAPYVIEESAILFESGADRFMDRTVAVIAPETIRIRRVCRRDHQNEAAIKARIANQMSDEERARRADYILKADDKTLLIPQILALHQQLLAL